MLTSIARHSPVIIAGSALTGFGLAFGRDVYRKAKDKWLWLLILLLCLIGVFFAGIWLFRNYRTVRGTLFKKLGALIVLAASCAGVNLTAAVTIGLVAPDSLRVDDIAPHRAVVFLEPPLLWIVVVQIETGSFPRARRRRSLYGVGGWGRGSISVSAGETSGRCRGRFAMGFIPPRAWG